MTITNHAPTGRCDGHALIARRLGYDADGNKVLTAADALRCPECARALCACEHEYGHDCEVA
jgi:hypothetical protein